MRFFVVVQGDEIIVTFAEREPMQPETLVSWFYPGESLGHQFVCSTMEQHALAQVKRHTEMVKTQKKNQTAVED